MNFTVTNYDFKKAMQALIVNQVDPILDNHGFKKYKKNSYVRVKGDLAQLISFFIEKYQLKAYAYFLPIYVPNDNIIDYGIEITGTTGCRLLAGKYFTTMYEKEKKDLAIQLEHYQNDHVKNFDKIILSIETGILPEMDRVNSLQKFIEMIESDSEIVFGNNYGRKRHINNVYLFIMAVYRCICGRYVDGREQLFQLKEQLEDSGELEYDLEKDIFTSTESLLCALCQASSDDMKYRFIESYDSICNIMRKKYKLLK